jgi:hypothetical protein
LWSAHNPVWHNKCNISDVTKEQLEDQKL